MSDEIDLQARLKRIGKEVRDLRAHAAELAREGGADVAYWWNQPADWWEFWLPQSGWIGGAVLGALAASIIALIV